MRPRKRKLAFVDYDCGLLESVSTHMNREGKRQSGAGAA